MERLSAPLLNANGSHQNGADRHAREQNHIQNVEMSGDPA